MGQGSSQPLMHTTIVAGGWPPMAVQPLTVVTTYGVGWAVDGLAPCPGCNDAYRTVCSGYQHNQAECVAWKRGYEAGLAAGRREALPVNDYY